MINLLGNARSMFNWYSFYAAVHKQRNFMKKPTSMIVTRNIWLISLNLEEGCLSKTKRKWFIHKVTSSDWQIACKLLTRWAWQTIWLWCYKTEKMGYTTKPTRIIWKYIHVLKFYSDYIYHQFNIGSPMLFW